MGNLRGLFLGKRSQNAQKFQGTYFRDELSGLAKEFLEKHMTECYWGEIQDEGKHCPTAI